MTLIRFENVTRTYQLGETVVEALCGVDFEIVAGEFVAIVGPSGSGKSTLCNLIGAVDQPTTGRVSIHGAFLDGLSDDDLSEHRNRSVGFVFQDFNLIPVLSALENVILPLQLAAEVNADAKSKAVCLLEDLGLAEHMEHRPDQLSGGQRQRVAIARALITDPPIIVADEPTANLDSGNACRILELMARFNEERGTTFIFSTHDPRLLDRVKRRIHLLDGRITDDTRTAGREA
ncbi:MAG: ABC transporter ATP-binding protein [Coraliomargarita sp.]